MDTTTTEKKFENAMSCGSSLVQKQFCLSGENVIG